MPKRNKSNGPEILPATLRRRTFLGGAIATGAVLATSSGWSTNVSGEFRSRPKRPFDDDWRFRRDDVPGAEQPGFDDAAWRRLDLPHDWSIEDEPGQLHHVAG